MPHERVGRDNVPLLEPGLGRRRSSKATAWHGMASLPQEPAMVPHSQQRAECELFVAEEMGNGLEGTRQVQAAPPLQQGECNISHDKPNRTQCTAAMSTV